MRIGFVGPFDSTNFGDYAMLINNIYSLGKHSYTLFVTNERIMEAIEKEYLGEYQVKHVSLFVNNSFVGLKNGMDIGDNDTYAYTPIEIINELKNRKEVFQELVRLQVLIVNGGGYFNHPWNKKYRKPNLFAMMATILLANELKVKIVFTGNTFGPFGDNYPLFQNFFGVLQNVSFSCRDDIYSPLEMKRIGISKEIKILPDDLYFMNERLLDEDKYEIELPEHYVLLEMNDHMSIISKKYKLLNDFTKTMSEKYGLKTCIMPCHEGWGGENQCREIAKEVSDIIYIPYFDDRTDKPRFRKIEEVLHVVKKSDLIICQKYHLFVLGIANNVPSIFGMRDVYGDKSYCYTKSAGVLKTVFSNQNYSETEFIKMNIWNAIECTMVDAESILQNQHLLFNQNKYDNELYWNERRKAFLKNHIYNS